VYAYGGIKFKTNRNWDFTRLNMTLPTKIGTRQQKIGFDQQELGFNHQK
jgi:hypothetical protein